MKLFLNSLRVDCIIGERPDERTRTQTLVVDLEIECHSRAAETDSLADAVDYAALAEAVSAALVKAECRLIERAAAVALSVALSTPGVDAAGVRVTKSGAVAGLASASVELRGRRTGSAGPLAE